MAGHKTVGKGGILMSVAGKLEQYEQLFPTVASKAAAFDMVAEHFYAGNFGQMTKADFETLLFSIYINQILERDDKDFSAYGDYKLAKELGITQSKVSNLKVRKQLQYPRKYIWQESFALISNRARYENGKIKLQIPDINLYYDIKNAIEDQGGFIEVSLTKGLLVVPLDYFLDLMEAIVEDNDRELLRKCVRDEFRKYQKDQEFVEAAPFRKQLKGFTTDVLINIISGVAGNLDGGGTSKILKYAISIIRNTLNAIEEGTTK